MIRASFFHSYTFTMLFLPERWRLWATVYISFKPGTGFCDRKTTKMDFDSKSGSLLCLRVIMWIRDLWKWFVTKVWTALGVRIREAFKYCKLNLKGAAGWKLEQMLIETCTSKVRLGKLQLGTRAPLALKLEPWVSVIENLYAYVWPYSKKMI